MVDFTPNTNVNQDEQIGNIDIDMTPVYNRIELYPSFSNWNYSMRRSMQEIVPGLFLGPYSAAQRQCEKHLLDIGITHIICVRQDIEANIIRPQCTNSFTYLTLDIANNVTENIIRFFPKVKKFIDDALNKNLKVLVHGNTGTSRSATLVLAYVMEKFGLSSSDAYRFVKERRSCINPIDCFLAQLTEYEPICKARQLFEKGGTSYNNRKLKRKNEQFQDNSNYDLIQPPSSPICFENNGPTEDFSNTINELLLKQNS